MKLSLSSPCSAVLLTIVLLVSSAGAGAQSEQEIEQVEDARYAAMVNMNLQALGDILADEFLYHRASRKVSTKSEFIDGLKTGEVRFNGAERYDVRIRFYGDIAASMGSTRVDYERNGELRQEDLRYLNVWVKRDGHWQLVARQSAFKPK